MTASEMFKELGFEKIKSVGIVKAAYKKEYNYGINNHMTIEFYKCFEARAVGMNHFDDGERVECSISVELIKAINKQLEELGWSNG